ncbi:MAG TPA: SpoIIE family protein phosphatase [candidate division Zixibacteria bacterium]|nr:SpoIIE family protein phosphatase [candidate division Zixibacteria bacterium]MDD4917049.1 SpoIIE family protein phosphatase [candidate division Zixibacteria bacterium]MDM7972854.1 SpoIIE family protein phosphatase [candidate division Zixibacteria bacterium]HOD65275.1 SpoIIE family protein phosphatase [candidate division Zixibacteria bacterium]HPI32876.1 SpoIIE family protein phosphatase [candidate division Zixibacteria bacterium]
MNFELVQIVLFLLTGGFLVFLAVTIVRDNFANRLNRVTATMLFFAGLGPLFLALGAIVRLSPDTALGFEESTLYHLQHLWEFFFPLLLLFAWIFPEDRLREFKHNRLRYLIFAPPALHLALVLLYNQFTGVLRFLQIEPGDSGFVSIILNPLAKVLSFLLLSINTIRAYDQQIFGALNALYVVVAVYFLESGRRMVTNPRLLTQTRVLFRGMRIGLAPYVIAFAGGLLLPRLFSDDVQAVLVVAGALVGAVFLAYATIRFQFLDVQLRFRQSFVYTITSGLLVGLYILLVVESRSFFTPLFGAQAQVVSYAFIIVILLLFQPINNAIDNLIRTLFIRTRTDHRNIIERFSRQVISLFDPVKLRGIIEDTLKTALLVERVYFVLFDDEVGEYALTRSQDQPRRIVLSRDDLLLRGINLLDSPAFLQTLGDYLVNSPLAELLTERQVKLVLPMKDAKHMLGFLALTDKVAGYRYSSEDLNLLGVLSNQMVTALTNARLYVDSLERLRLEEEVSLARQIQLDLLPAAPPKLELCEIAVHSTPSRTVGGDFYDFIPIDDARIGMVIADASGKGMPAALMIAQIQAIIRSEVNNGNPIGAIMTHLNDQVVAATSSEKYVTLFYGELNRRTGRLEYCNAGHNYPVLVRSDGAVELLVQGGPIIGAFPEMRYESADVQFRPGDVLFLFTDGLSEAMDGDGREYGEERVRRFVREHRHREAGEILEAILEDVRAFDATFPPRDDTTIITMKSNHLRAAEASRESHGQEVS